MLESVTPLALSADDVAAFRANGFLTLRDFVDADEARRLRPIFERLLASPIGMTTGDRSDIIGDVDRTATVPQITHLERYTGDLLDSPIRRRAFEIARALIGDDVVLDCETMIVKLPRSPDPTPWHQDEAFWPAGSTREAVSFWVPLQDVTSDGGCMEFVPGSHRGDVLTHRPLGGVEHANAFEIVDLDVRSRVVCPLAAGSATVHHARTAHSTGANLGDVARFAYILVFLGPRRELAVPRDFAWQGGRSRDRRRAASRTGLSGLVNVTLRKAAVAIARLNALNDRRNWRNWRA